MAEYNVQINKYNATDAGYDQLYPEPMKHASTHGAGGSDPVSLAMSQVEGLSGALAGKAPDGYGLGIVLANTTGPVITDFHTKLPTGFYYVQSGASNGPIGGATFAVVISRSADEITVFTGYPDGHMAVLKYANSEWQPWEYINPPMIADVVYRTTERHFGNPVYKKMDSNGVVWWSTDQTTWKLEADRVGAAPAYTYGTTELTAGTSPLATGTMYLCYE